MFLNMLLDEMAKIKAQFDSEEGVGYQRPSFYRLQDVQRSVALYVLAMRDHIQLNLPAAVPDMEMIQNDDMIAKAILFAGSPCVLACDAHCSKAWGSNTRPRRYRTASGEYAEVKNMDAVIDEDDYAYLADSELGIAPADSPFTENDEHKPQRPSQRLNRWCARECERSVIVDIGETVELPDFSQRFYNFAPHTRSVQSANDE